jgi:hypothetical protein
MFCIIVPYYSLIRLDHSHCVSPLLFVQHHAVPVDLQNVLVIILEREQRIIEDLITEDEISEYIRDRAMFLAEVEKVEFDELRGKFESEDEVFEEMDSLFDKYGSRWVELIEERKKQEEILKM